MIKLTNDQAIIRCDTPFGLFDYFMVEMVYKEVKNDYRYNYKDKKYVIREIRKYTTDELAEACKHLFVDFQSGKMRAYTNKGANLRQRWNDTPNYKKVKPSLYL